MIFPDAVDAPVCLQMVRAAFEPTGGLDDLQSELIHDLASMLWGLDFADITVEENLSFRDVHDDVKTQAVHLIALLETHGAPTSPRSCEFCP